MVASIPASAIVRVVPNVLGTGGSGLDLVGLILTISTRVPVGTVQRFASAEDVSAFFGPISTEATLAARYFAGFDGSDIKPAALLFSQYPQMAVPAYLRGGPFGLTLTQLRALSGVLSLTVDGRSVTSGNINLGSATSFSDAASIIQTAIADSDAAVTGAISGNTLTVTAVARGAVAVGQSVTGTGVAPGTVVTAFGTGTGGNGTYTISNSQTVASGSLTLGATTVAYDSVAGAFVITAGTPGDEGDISYASGTLAGPLALNAAGGAVISLGADSATPGGAMGAVKAQTQDFASFMTAFKPSLADMVAFAQWTDQQQDRFLYVAWDNDLVATQSTDTASFGYVVRQTGLSGTMPVYDRNSGAPVAAFIMGAVASVDYERLNGRVTLAFRASSGLAAGVTNETIAANLIANGYNFYGSYATANDQFTFLYPGQVSGDFAWADSYVNQIWLNANLQLALMNLLTTAGSIPYNVDGYATIEATLLDPINAAIDFGAIRPGVTLTSAQAADVNNAAGRRVSDVLEQRGWYAQVQAASPAVRASRGSPPVYLWYTDGQSIQRITLSSVAVQ